MAASASAIFWHTKGASKDRVTIKGDIPRGPLDSLLSYLILAVHIALSNVDFCGQMRPSMAA